MTDAEVLDTTEAVHDRMDSVVGRSMEARASAAADVWHTCRLLLRDRSLTTEQHLEVRVAARRVLTIGLGVREDQVQSFLIGASA